MNEAVFSDNQSEPFAQQRRGFISGLGAIMAGGAIAAAVGGQSAGNPDAALIAACDEFAALEREINAHGDLEDAAREAAQAPLLARQERLVDVIFDAKAKTPAGHAARARAAIAYQPELVEPEFGYDGNAMVILSSMLRDILG